MSIVSAEQLRQYIDRLERLEEEKTEISAHIREVMAEAKGNGFDVKAIKQIMKIRKMKPQERMEQEEIITTYMHALGMEPA